MANTFPATSSSVVLYKKVSALERLSSNLVTLANKVHTESVSTESVSGREYSDTWKKSVQSLLAINK